MEGRRSSHLKRASLGHPREVTHEQDMSKAREQAPGLAGGRAFEVEGKVAPGCKDHLEEPYHWTFTRTRGGYVRAGLKAGGQSLSPFLPLLFSDLLAK